MQQMIAITAGAPGDSEGGGLLDSTLQSDHLHMLLKALFLSLFNPISILCSKKETSWHVLSQV